MTGYKATWASLDADAAREAVSTLVRRVIHAEGGVEVHLAVSAPDARRQLWVRLADGWNGDTGSLPRWKGCRISTWTGTERPRPRTFLVIEQGDGSPADVFEALSAYACDALITAPRGSSTIDVVRGCLEQWKAFFEEEGLDALSREAQQGLYGELWLLRGHLMPALGARAAVQSWTGSRRTNHDFQLRGHAVEVKTTSARRHHVMRIRSERQLDTGGIASLHIAFLALARLDDGGETLTGIIDAIRGSLASDAPTRRAFEERLLAARYTDAHASMYTAGYACRDMNGYRVVSGFPRIVERDIPEGTADVSYSIAIAACEPFRITLEDALAPMIASTRGDAA